MSMSPRLLRPRSTVHPEAAAWAGRVVANGGTVSGTTLSAASKFCASIASAGIRDRFYRLNLFCGTNLNAALVPLYRGPSLGGTQYGGATDTNNAFVGVGTDYAETGASGGLTGNGSTKFLNTGFPANTISAASAHLGLGLLSVVSQSGFRSGIGAFRLGDAKSFEISTRSNNNDDRSAVFTRYGTSTDRFGPNIGFNGAYLAAGNIVASYPTFYRDAVSVGVDATTSADYSSADSFYVFAASSSNASATGHSSIRLGWYSIGAAMTSGQVGAFNTAINSLYSALGRS